MLQSLAQTLFSTYRRRVLGLLLLHPDQSYYVREIARLTHTTAGTVHKELKRLADVGILSCEKRGNQLTYRANRDCPIFEELANIMRKTSGLAAVIQLALKPVMSCIQIAFIFGSMAQARESATSDVDVMIIGSIHFMEVVKLLYPSQDRIGREINPKVFDEDEWKKRVVKGDAFVKDVLRKPKIFLIGNDHDLRQLTRHQS